MSRERAYFTFDNSAGRSCCFVFFQAYIFFKVCPLRNCRRDPNRNISQTIIPLIFTYFILCSIAFNLAYVSLQQCPSSISSASIDLDGRVLNLQKRSLLQAHQPRLRKKIACKFKRRAALFFARFRKSGFIFFDKF